MALQPEVYLNIKRGSQKEYISITMEGTELKNCTLVILLWQINKGVFYEISKKKEGFPFYNKALEEFYTKLTET